MLVAVAGTGTGGRRQGPFPDKGHAHQTLACCLCLCLCLSVMYRPPAAGQPLHSRNRSHSTEGTDGGLGGPRPSQGRVSAWLRNVPRPRGVGGLFVPRPQFLAQRDLDLGASQPSQRSRGQCNATPQGVLPSPGIDAGD